MFQYRWLNVCVAYYVSKFIHFYDVSLYSPATLLKRAIPVKNFSLGVKILGILSERASINVQGAGQQTNVVKCLTNHVLVTLLGALTSNC